MARCIEFFFNNPSAGEVFNLGGGRANSVSILEAFDRAASLSGIPMQYRYLDMAREGDHICYISDLTHVRKTLSGWDLTKTLEDIFEEIVSGWKNRLKQLPA